MFFDYSYDLLLEIYIEEYRCIYMIAIHIIINYIIYDAIHLS